MLPEFDETATIDPHSAKQDKIDLTLGTWLVRGNDHDASMLLDGISTIPIPENSEGLLWFNRFQGFRFGRGTIAFRGRGHGGRRQEGVPLISGKLEAKRVGARDEHSPSHFHISATISINPTRFVRYRGVSFRTHLSPELWSETIDPHLLTSGNLVVRHAGETVLDGNDNVILTQRGMFASRPEVWPYQVRCYFNNIIHLLETQIAQAATENGITVTHPERDINLRSVETYWEFASDDALHSVSMLVPTMQGLGREASIRNFPIAEENINGNSLSVRIRLTQGITCTFYAKTDKRVRLEFKHDLTERAEVIGGSHTTNEPIDVLVWLDRLAEDAAERGTHVLGRLRRELSHSVSQRPVYELLSRLAAVSDSQEANDMLVSVLVNTRRIELKRNYDPLRAAVTQLVSQQVLERALNRAGFAGGSDF